MFVRAIGLSALAILMLSACDARRDARVSSAIDERQSASHPVLEGLVRDADGNPVPGATIRLHGGLATRWEIARVTTGPDGRYRFDPVPTGALVQSDDGRWDNYLGVSLEHPELVSADGKNWWDLTLSAADGGCMSRHFELIPGGTLVARLVSQSRGVPPLPVELRLSNPNRSAAQFTRYATSDAEGHIHVTGLAPGPYMVDINDPALDYAFVGDFYVPSGGYIQMTWTLP